MIKRALNFLATTLVVLIGLAYVTDHFLQLERNKRGIAEAATWEKKSVQGRRIAAACEAETKRRSSRPILNFTPGDSPLDGPARSFSTTTSGYSMTANVDIGKGPVRIVCYVDRELRVLEVAVR